MALRDEWRYGFITIDLWRGFFRLAGGLVLHDTAGGRNELRVLATTAAATLGFPVPTFGLGTTALSGLMVVQRVRSDDGAIAGTVIVGKPPAGMSILAGLAWHLDLEGSSALSRTMSTAGHFALGRRSFADRSGSVRPRAAKCSRMCAGAVGQ